MIYITSDLHLMHNQEFIYKPRGYDSAVEMSEDLVNKWNEVIHEDDTVYVLGDLIFGDLDIGKVYLSRLKGSIKVILGNHDGSSKIPIYESLSNIEILGYSTILQYKKYHFYLSHYPTITSNKDDQDSLKTIVINLCGHTHSNDSFRDFDLGLIFHVECDTNQGYPWLLDNILYKIKEKLSQTD